MSQKRYSDGTDGPQNYKPKPAERVRCILRPEAIEVVGRVITRPWGVFVECGKYGEIGLHLFERVEPIESPESKSE